MHQMSGQLHPGKVTTRSCLPLLKERLVCALRPSKGGARRTAHMQCQWTADCWPGSTTLELLLSVLSSCFMKVSALSHAMDSHPQKVELAYGLHLRRLGGFSTSGPSHKTASLSHHACRLDLPKLEGIIFSLLCSSAVEVRQRAVEALVTLRALHRQVVEQQLSGGLSNPFFPFWPAH